jgi:hypothetical protein
MRRRVGIGVERASAAENRVRCPLSKRTPSPGPFTAAPRVARVNFVFGSEGRRQLLELLTRAAPHLARRRTPPISVHAVRTAAAASGPLPKTIADWIIATAESQIQLLLSVRNADPKNVPGKQGKYRGAKAAPEEKAKYRVADPNAVPGNPANYRAAIRRLRTALKPFVNGWVDVKTAKIADWGRIDTDLTKRHAELETPKRPLGYLQRELDFNCSLIADAAREGALIADVELSDDTIARFIQQAMSLADIKLPDPDDSPADLRKRVFE